MYVVSGEEMVRIDQGTIKRYGVPALVLMENAGVKVAQAVMNYFAEQDIQISKKVVVVAGKGNNGGDGFVAARHLANKGIDVKVFLLGKFEDVKGEAKVNLDILRKLRIPVLTISNEKDLNKLRIALVYSSIIVDALYGTGFKGGIIGLGEKLVSLINNSRNIIISADIPSGLEASTGKVHGVCVKANETVTFAFPKIGLFLNQAADYVGQVTVVDISIPPELPAEENIQRWIITEDMARKLMPARPPNSHKGTYGHTMVVGGSTGMTGAAVLTCEGALQVGAGLVSLGIPASLNNILEQKLTEVMTKPLPETIDGTLGRAALQPLISTLSDKAVLALGPGLSQNKETKELVVSLLAELTVPVVIDADGLNALADTRELLPKIKAPCVITPHPGELSKLLDIPVAKIQQNRLEIAIEAARRFQVTVVLKGNNTIVATEKGKAWINVTGNSGMATAGSGDVLTGIIAGLVGQGLPVEEAAVLGVYLHGSSGDVVMAAKGMLAMKASDLLVHLPQVLKKLEMNKNGTTGLG